MRIIAGKWRGRGIVSPKGMSTRPTVDRTREAVFSKLYSDYSSLDDLVVLDCFAGSGALGLEALSRGAARCTFVESDKGAHATLRGNIEILGAGDQSQTLLLDTLARPESIAHLGPYDIVLLDPPYSYEPDTILMFIRRLVALGALSDIAIIVYEHDTDTRLSLPEDFECTCAKRYGGTTISYIEYRG